MKESERPYKYQTVFVSRASTKPNFHLFTLHGRRGRFAERYCFHPRIIQSDR